MSSSVTALGAQDERPVWLASGTELAFAILTRPKYPDGTGVLLLHSGVHTMSAGTGWLWARLARSVAATGSWVARMDFAGSGDSPGLFERSGDGQPMSDVAAALDALAERGAQRIAIVGHCYSCVPAMALGVARGSVRHLVLVSPPLTWVTPGQTIIQAGGPAPLASVLGRVFSKDVAKQLVTDAHYRGWLAERAQRRARSLQKTAARRTTALARQGLAQLQAALGQKGQPEPLAAPSGIETEPVMAPASAGQADKVLIGEAWLAQLARDGVRTTILYGAEDDMYSDFLAACQGGLQPLISHPTVEVVVHPQSVHGLAPSAQDEICRYVAAAVRAMAGAGA